MVYGLLRYRVVVGVGGAGVGCQLSKSESRIKDGIILSKWVALLLRRLWYCFYATLRWERVARMRGERRALGSVD